MCMHIKVLKMNTITYLWKKIDGLKQCYTYLMSTEWYLISYQIFIKSKFDLKWYLTKSIEKNTVFVLLMGNVTE